MYRSWAWRQVRFVGQRFREGWFTTFSDTCPNRLHRALRSTEDTTLQHLVYIGIRRFIRFQKMCQCSPESEQTRIRGNLMLWKKSTEFRKSCFPYDKLFKNMVTGRTMKGTGCLAGSSSGRYEPCTICTIFRVSIPMHRKRCAEISYFKYERFTAYFGFDRPDARRFGKRGDRGRQAVHRSYVCGFSNSDTVAARSRARAESMPPRPRARVPESGSQTPKLTPGA